MWNDSIVHFVDLDWYKCFAVEILKGNVFRKLKKFREKLLASPQTILKSWAHLQPRTKGIVNLLVASDAKNRKVIESEWEGNQEFLLKQICDWIPESIQDDIRTIWPPL